MHKGKFDYSLVQYIDAKTPIQIVCPKHGKFSQKPDKHLAKNSKGCRQCWMELKSLLEKSRNYSEIKKKQPFSKEVFLERTKEQFGGKFQYDLNKYTGISGNKIKITCPIHGEHETTPRSHLQSNSGCPKCGLIMKNSSNTGSYDTTIKQLQNKFNFNYDYPDYNRESYKNKRSKIDIICKTHGLFQKSAQKHLSGQSCWHCEVDRMIKENVLVGGYSEQLFRDRPELKQSPSILYYLKINDCMYYKIGISRFCVENRIRSLKCKAGKCGEPLKIEVVSVSNAALYDCFLQEQKILNDNANHRIYRAWSTELFNKNVFS